jgi:hypothetical protein
LFISSKNTPFTFALIGTISSGIFFDNSLNTFLYFKDNVKKLSFGLLDLINEPNNITLFTFEVQFYKYQNKEL